MELTDIFVLLVGLLSLLTNGVLLFILLRDPLKCFKASTTYFIISLSLSDLLTGANSCFWGLDKLVQLSPNFRRFLLSLFWITTQASFLTLLAMSVERFLIVKYPLYCRIWITKKRVSFIIVLIWLVSAILGGLVLLPPPMLFYVQFSIFTEFFFSVFVIAMLYAFILLGIRNSQKSLKRIGSASLHRGSSRSDVQSTRIYSRKKSTNRLNNSYTEEPKSQSNYQLNRIYRECPGSSKIIVSEWTQNGGSEIHERTSSQSQSPVVDNTGNKSPIVNNDGDKSRVFNNAAIVGNGKENIELCGPLLNCSATRKSFAKVGQAIQAAQVVLKTREKSRSLQQEQKLTAVVLLLVGVLALTVLPYLLASQIQVGYMIFCKCPVSQVLVRFNVIYFPIELLNFAVNPLIYAWRLPQYRSSLKYLCTCYKPAVESTTTVERDAPSFRSGSSPCVKRGIRNAWLT